MIALLTTLPELYKELVHQGLTKGSLNTSYSDKIIIIDTKFRQSIEKLNGVELKGILVDLRASEGRFFDEAHEAASYRLR